MQKITTDSGVNVVKFETTPKKGLLFRYEEGYVKIYNYNDKDNSGRFITMIKLEDFADMIEFLSIKK